MRFTVFTVLTCVTAALAINQPQKAVIVSYAAETPQWVVDQAMDKIKEAGGTITHQYNIIKGFAAQASAQILDTVQSMGSDYSAAIEEEQIVSVS